jgi:hypothetical protein
MVFGLKDAGKGFKNGFEFAKMLDFEFFRVSGTQRAISRSFKKIFFRYFLRERGGDKLHLSMLLVATLLWAHTKKVLSQILIPELSNLSNFDLLSK